jgi:hypothetical protein
MNSGFYTSVIEWVAMSLQSTYNILGESFHPNPIPASLQGDERVKAAERNKKKLIESLLCLRPGAEIKPDDLEALKEYLSKHSTSQKLITYLFGEGFKIKSTKDGLAQESLAKFKECNKGYFDAENPQHQALYQACYTMCMHRAKLVEKDNQVQEVGTRAYKMMVLFSPEPLTDNIQDIFKNADVFITKHLSNPGVRAVHDIGINKMPAYNPANPPFNLPAWKAVLNTCGMELVRGFGDIVEVEEVIKKEKGLEGALESTNVPKDKKGFEDAFKKVVYERYDENPEFGDLFRHYKAPKAMFNKALDRMKEGGLKTDVSDKKLAAKIEDHIPDVAVKLSNDMYMVKLPSNDPRALILGQITNCCQSIDGHSAQCVMDGVNLANNGFYVIVKAAKDKPFDPRKWGMEDFEKQGHKLVGQSYTWRGKDGGLTLDSIEMLGSFRNEVNVADAMKKFGTTVSEKDPTVSRVMLGVGGGTAAVMEADVNKNPELLQSNYVETMRTGVNYYDSYNQYEVHVSNALKIVREAMKSTFTGSFEERVNKCADILQEWYSPNSVHGENIAILLKPFGIELDHLYIPYGADAGQIKNALVKIIISQCDQANDAIQDSVDLFLQKISKALSTDIQIDNNVLRMYRSQLEVAHITSLEQAKFLQGMDVREITKLGEYARVMTSSTITQYCQDLESLRMIHRNFMDLDDDTKKLLTSKNAQAIYGTGKCSIGDLQSLSPDYIQVLTNPNIRFGYDRGVFTFEDLMKITPVDRIWDLIERYAMLGYQYGYFTFDQLSKVASADVGKLTTLFNCYKEGWFTFDQISGESSKISALTTPAAQYLYSTGVAFGVLQALEENKLLALTSSNAEKCYIGSHIKFADLERLSVPEIRALISDKAYNGYKNKCFTFDQLSKVNLQEYEKLADEKLLTGYQSGWFTFDQLSKLDQQTRDAVTSSNAQSVYRSGYSTVNDLLQAKDVESINAITSSIAQLGYNEGWFAAKDLLKAKDAESINALTRARDGYRSGYFTVNDLLQAKDAKSIKAMTSSDAKLGYDKGWYVAKDLLKAKDAESIDALTSVRGYEKGYFTVNDLLQVNDPEHIKALADPVVIYGYKQGYFTVNDLLQVKDVERIKALTTPYSIGILYVDKEKACTFDQLKVFSAQEITVLLSSDAREQYKKCITFEQYAASQGITLPPNPSPLDAAKSHLPSKSTLDKEQVKTWVEKVEKSPNSPSRSRPDSL